MPCSKKSSDGWNALRSKRIPKMKKFLCTAVFAFISSLVFSSGGRSDATGRTYNIGDRGPAGGFIFYDRGFIADGLRYLEAAPTDFTAQWGGYRGTGSNTSDYYDIAGTGTSVGDGKRNTQIIAEYLNRIGERNRAAQICAAMNVNGYTDWFLPSKEELALMYQNLKQRGLGGFTNTWYCPRRSTIIVTTRGIRVSAMADRTTPSSTIRIRFVPCGLFKAGSGEWNYHT
jgi:hypothetical protein